MAISTTVRPADRGEVLHPLCGAPRDRQQSHGHERCGHQRGHSATFEPGMERPQEVKDHHQQGTARGETGIREQVTSNDRAPLPGGEAEQCTRDEPGHASVQGQAGDQE